MTSIIDFIIQTKVSADKLSVCVEEIRLTQKSYDRLLIEIRQQWLVTDKSNKDNFLYVCGIKVTK